MEKLSTGRTDMQSGMFTSESSDLLTFKQRHKTR